MQAAQVIARPHAAQADVERGNRPRIARRIVLPFAVTTFARSEKMSRAQGIARCHAKMGPAEWPAEPPAIQKIAAYFQE